MKKINSSIKLIFTICFFSLSQILISQESKTNRIGEKPIENINKEQPGSLKHKTKVSTNSNANANVQPRIDTEGKSFQLDENDAYQGRTVEFLSQITLKELPLDFPKYEKWMGVRHYNEVIDEYYKKHLDILIPSVKQKLTQVH